MQAHARVCEENKRELELEKKNERLSKQQKQFYDERYEFEGSYGESGETYRDNIIKDDLP